MEKSTVAAAIIALLGGLLGVFVGQKMSATTESDKLIREKLDQAYVNTLALPSLALDLHSAVLDPISDANFLYTAGRYETARTKYREGIARVVAVSDLYEPRLDASTQKVADCANRFSSAAGDQFLLRAELGGKVIVHPPSYINPSSPLVLPESINMTVALRLECEKATNELKKSVASAMELHL
ncbi:hypothetical protein [Candidatus Ferrigenium straubiae]|jgi:hypothetical protein|uniref:hypothetical protein n=1 Tax=Candidatus Ferrigenium straubiae TaxID=2919506 RepID=UPI003F4ABF88